MRIPTARWAGLLIWVILAVPAGAADWTMFGGDNIHSGVAPSDVMFPLGLKWQFATGMKTADIVSCPVVDARRVYFCVGSKAYALDRATGEKLWEFNSRSIFDSSPAVFEGTVYVGAQDGNLYALDANKGSVRWKFHTGGPIESSPNIRDGVLYIGSDDANVYAIRLADRALMWQYGTAGAVKSTPALWRGMCYVASTDGYLYAIDNTGNLRWRTSLGSTPCFSSPSIEGGKVIVGAGYNLVAVDARSGQRRWTFITGGLVTGSPAVFERFVYIGSEDTSVYAISAATGRAVWRVGLGVPVQSSPTVVGDTVLVRGADGLLVALERLSGKTVWCYRTGRSLKVRKPEPSEYAPEQAVPGAGMGVGQPGAPSRTPGRRVPTRIGGWGGRLGGAYGGYGAIGGRYGYAGAGTPGGTEGGWGTGYRQQPIYEFYEEVLSSPAVSTDAVFVLGDDGALYALTSRTPDGTGPVVKDAQLDVQGAQDTIVSYAVRVADANEMPGKYAEWVKIPGTPPITISVAVDDPGSGVNPEAIETYLDDKKQDFIYDPETGVIWVDYQPAGKAGVALKNGVHWVTFNVPDWQGNVTQAHVDFLVDNNLPPPSAPVTQPYGTPGAGAVPGAGGVPGMPEMGGGLMP